MDAVSTGHVPFLYSCVRRCKPKRGGELETSTGIFLALLVAVLGCSSGTSMPKTLTNQAPMNGPGGGSAGSAASSAASPSAGTGSGQAPAASSGTAGRAAIASASGSAGQVAAPSAAGSAPMKGPPDPKVTFDWPQTQADQSDCRPGTYTGVFMCEVDPPGTDPGSGPIAEGAVAITLTKSPSGEFLEISGGHLQINLGGALDIQARIIGKLDCSTNTLNGMAVDGVYGLGDANAVTAGTLDGKVSGMLDRPNATLTGTWDLNWDALGYTGACNGPFTATLMP